MSELVLPLTSKTLAEILRDHGYETHPKGMAQPLGVDIEQSSEGRTAYFDVNADAVRRNGGEVPERPIRLTFEKASMKGGSPVWRLESIEELAPGVKSKALDRLPESPKRNAPWPD
jgi:arylsulfatase A-like enzyme